MRVGTPLAGLIIIRVGTPEAGPSIMRVGTRDAGPSFSPTSIYAVDRPFILLVRDAIDRGGGGVAIDRSSIEEQGRRWRV
jgi:hypothetical protein